jgi:hypothetical protein
MNAVIVEVEESISTAAAKGNTSNSLLRSQRNSFSLKIS